MGAAYVYGIMKLKLHGQKGIILVRKTGYP
jgi:hypothetical protein